MRIHLSPRDIKLGYKAVKHLACESYRKGRIEDALTYVRHCTVIAQQFNWIYADDELEDLLSAIGESVLQKNENSFGVVPGRIVFYDDFCTSFVLALQYMRALVADGKEILYITSRDIKGKSQFANIIDEVSQYRNVTVYIVPQGEIAYRIRDIYQSIMAFKPEKVLLHMTAFSLAIPALYHLPSVVDRYIINLADQTFWLGKKAIDYSLEFRPFGASVSIQKRGLKKEQLLMVPFYPICDDNPFEGFPGQCSREKVIIFSGGDLYKVVDSEGMYWKLVKTILDRYPQVVFLFATKVSRQGAEIIDGFITENHFQDRFIYINYRKDINEVFKHCDIYMGTCPASGSLMSQLAAVNGKPILQFYYPGTPDDETEQAICINKSFSISFSDEDKFLTEADRLIKRIDYRKSQGEKLRKAMMNETIFNDLVSKSLSERKAQMPIKEMIIDFALLDTRWMSLEKEGYTDMLPYVYGLLGKSTCLRKAFPIFFKKQLRRLFKSEV